jgi:hypothetical protein
MLVHGELFNNKSSLDGRETRLENGVENADWIDNWSWTG